MKILDGRYLSEVIKAELKAEVDIIISNGGKVPHLVAVLVGDNPASASYVKNKIKFCREVGYKSTLINESKDISEEGLLSIIQGLNDDEDVDGYIVQLPLPKHINEININLAIDYKKDVDGFHPMNFGRMAEGMTSYLPATPAGILEMLKRYEIETDGKHCVVIGRSNIVGSPMSILLARKGYPGNCTVTITHSRTKDIKAELLRADIIIAAIGIPEFVKADMVKLGAVIIDVGINRIEDPSRESGYKLVGDVAYDEVAAIASAITPVPGGVGPMTVTSLMMNTLKAAKKEIYK